MKVSRTSHITLAATALLAGTVFAQVKAGITVPAIKSAASLGTPEENIVALPPKEIVGKKIEYIVLSDVSNATTAIKNMRRLTIEDKVDLMIGSTATSNSLAMIDMAVESETSMITLAASARIIELMDAKRVWVSKTPQSDSYMATAVTEHMANYSVKVVTLIGLADTYGDSWVQGFDKVAGLYELKTAASERPVRTDTPVTGQVLKVMSVNPDTVLIVDSGTPAALPRRVLGERGYKGKLYQTHGVTNTDFLCVCGKDCEGTYLPAGLISVAEQLPDSNPVRKPALAYKTAYEKTYGRQVSTLDGHMWGAGLLLAQAISEALKKGQPGTPAFRRGSCDTIETTTNPAISCGVMNMSTKDHLGLDQRSRVMVEIKDGKWKLQN